MKDLVFLTLKKLYNGNIGHREFFFKKIVYSSYFLIFDNHNKHLVDTEYEV